ncbi:MAG: hypothetical protein ACE14P_09835 [Methanotrichaceae archaeon]
MIEIRQSTYVALMNVALMNTEIVVFCGFLENENARAKPRRK